MKPNFPVFCILGLLLVLFPPWKEQYGCEYLGFGFVLSKPDDLGTSRWIEIDFARGILLLLAITIFSFAVEAIRSLLKKHKHSSKLEAPSRARVIPIETGFDLSLGFFLKLCFVLWGIGLIAKTLYLSS